MSTENVIWQRNPRDITSNSRQQLRDDSILSGGGRVRMTVTFFSPRTQLRTRDFESNQPEGSERTWSAAGVGNKFGIRGSAGRPQHFRENDANAVTECWKNVSGPHMWPRVRDSFGDSRLDEVTENVFCKSTSVALDCTALVCMSLVSDSTC